MQWKSLNNYVLYLFLLKTNCKDSIPVKNNSHMTEALVEMIVPAPPARWAFKPGWTRYDPDTMKAYSVECPLEEAIVFDVETLVLEGSSPVMATALTPKAWYRHLSYF